MPFIGKQSTSNSQITNYTTTVGSGGQTNFTVVIEGGDETHVYLNGVLLKETTDYTVSSTQVSLISPAVENDIVEIKVFRSFALVDAVKATGGTFTGTVSHTGTLDVSGGTLTTSTAQKTAIVDGGKGNLAKGDVGLGNVDNESKSTMFASPTFTGTVAGVTKTHVGLSNVDNTADSAKPVSTAQQTEIDKLAYQGEPHIIPGVLYPAVAGKLLDGSTSHSGDYGTAQSDSRKYYYTDIKGSKPIKDPRIGGHFGSQRHKFKSLQLLEQETATHGDEVYSVDGRDWIRRVGEFDVHDGYGQQGHFLGHTATGDATNSKYFEIVGYFNAANYLSYAATNRDVNVFIDGTQNPSSTVTAGTSSVDTPLSNRYVDSSSVINIPITGLTTPGIHTLKIANVSGDYLLLFGIELIAQDTSNRNNIQIPSQDVVSYGKKFTVSGTPHYNPFAQSQTGADVTINSSTTNTAKLTGGWSGTGATYYSSELDTATSLGLSAWESTDYYRPVNGGRVVWWVNSSGDLKCSVNMMPPAGTAIGGVTGGHNVPTGTHNWATKYQPALHSTTIDHSQAEVAKTYNWREFGNGAANGGTLSATYADFSMSNASDSLAYVMDDGLTSLSADAVEGGVGSTGTGDFFYSGSTNKGSYFTFIGTGVSFKGRKSSALTAPINVAQNLPYGTHILKVYTDSSSNVTTVITLDGVQIDSSQTYSDYAGFAEPTIYQPKRPPIPEDAVVIADYMLMADFVPAGATASADTLSKGTRRSQCSRDWFYNSTLNIGFSTDAYRMPRGMLGYEVASAITTSLPYFGTHAVFENHPHSNRMNNAVLAGSTLSLETNTHIHVSESTMGIQDATIVGSQSGEWVSIPCIDVHTPIHTSHHYQTFETPFLHELIGGDRNMEQTNLVCSPDGKSWDELTRDTSYLGGLGINTDASSNQNTVQNLLFSEWRGKIQGASFYNKGFAIAYDRVICLIPGRYRIFYSTHADSGVSDGWSEIKVNGLEAVVFYTWGSNYTNPVAECVVDLVRGDYVQVFGNAKAGLDCQSVFNIQQV